MFLHIRVPLGQLSIHANNEPLGKSVEPALTAFGHAATSTKYKFKSEKGKALDPKKTAKANGLKENDMVYITEK